MDDVPNEHVGPCKNASVDGLGLLFKSVRYEAWCITMKT